MANVQAEELVEYVLIKIWNSSVMHHIANYVTGSLPVSRECA
jgi:hypothetical protein